MNPWMEYFFLGLLQGVAEFLPISSDGHLLLAEHYLGIREDNLFVTVMLHIGTLVATTLFFRKRIARALKPDQIKPALLAVVAASVPTAAIGLGVKKFLEMDGFSVSSQATLGAALLMVNAAVLLWGHWLWKRQQPVAGEPPLTLENIEESPVAATFPAAGPSALVGLMQGAATLPGVSRSGCTITGGMLVGLKAEDAFEFSFLLSIPAVAGVVLLMLKDFQQANIPHPGPLAMAVGVSFVVGYFALWALRHVVTSGKLHFFAAYCFLVGGGNLIWLLMQGANHG